MKRFFGYAILVVLVLAFALPTYAQTDIGFKGIGARLGYVMPEDPIDNTIGFGVQADLGTIIPEIHVGALIEYWKKSYDVGSASWSWSEFVIAPTAKYYFPVQSEFKPYGGGGIGLSIGKWSEKYDYAYLGQQEYSASDTKLGIFFMGGAEYEFNPNVTGFAELKYHMDGADYFGIFVGATYYFSLSSASN